ncbi:phytanoyl-CoA dioxygenase family protein [Luteitalea sp. TBR-22]|uniref:phytanoyl-CoA dioxygenase family protein n=1 Tax=Luteitalea sp. TBR-22 TaxID=2802971 RepID=UPI001EF6C407|nr:phytanoyl-CoA dioxygenase family protein [Luteitalea sp. TBR-22]
MSSPVNATRFEDDGFVVVREAFPPAVAAECRALLWPQTGCDPRDRSTWTRPVVRLGDQAAEPFRAAANTPALHAAFDVLVGPGRWTPRVSLGTCPVRFPSPEDPGDAGWHVDAGFYAADGSMRLTVDSRGRALLMLFLFSDTGPDDAPTRLLVGSHLDIPRLLQPAGPDGLTFMELAQRFPPSTLARPLAFATGRAGDVFLCHPFLVHAAQPHHGTMPRFLAQPPLHPAAPLQLDRADGAYSPVERAIRRGLGHPQ